MQWQLQNVRQTLTSQKTPHISPTRASYGVSVVSSLEKNWQRYNGYFAMDSMPSIVRMFPDTPLISSLSGVPLGTRPVAALYSSSDEDRRHVIRSQRRFEVHLSGDRTKPGDPFHKRFISSWWKSCEDWYCFYFNILKPRQNGRFFADAIFKRIFLNENISIPIKISLVLFLRV